MNSYLYKSHHVLTALLTTYVLHTHRYVCTLTQTWKLVIPIKLFFIEHYSKKKKKVFENLQQQFHLGLAWLFSYPLSGTF